MVVRSGALRIEIYPPNCSPGTGQDLTALRLDLRTFLTVSKISRQLIPESFN